MKCLCTYIPKLNSQLFLYLCLDHQFFEVSFPGVTGCSYSFCIIYSTSKAKKKSHQKKREINFSRTSLIFSYYLCKKNTFYTEILSQKVNLRIVRGRGPGWAGWAAAHPIFEGKPSWGKIFVQKNVFCPL